MAKLHPSLSQSNPSPWERLLDWVQAFQSDPKRGVLSWEMCPWKTEDAVLQALRGQRLEDVPNVWNQSDDLAQACLMAAGLGAWSWVELLRQEPAVGIPQGLAQKGWSGLLAREYAAVDGRFAFPLPVGTNVESLTHRHFWGEIWGWCEIMGDTPEQLLEAQWFAQDVQAVLKAIQDPERDTRYPSWKNRWPALEVAWLHHMAGSDTLIARALWASVAEEVHPYRHTPKQRGYKLEGVECHVWNYEKPRPLGSLGAREKPSFYNAPHMWSQARFEHEPLWIAAQRNNVGRYARSSDTPLGWKSVSNSNSHGVASLTSQATNVEDYLRTHPLTAEQSIKAGQAWIQRLNLLNEGKEGWLAWRKTKEGRRVALMRDDQLLHDHRLELGSPFLYQDKKRKNSIEDRLGIPRRDYPKNHGVFMKPWDAPSNESLVMSCWRPEAQDVFTQGANHQVEDRWSVAVRMGWRNLVKQWLPDIPEGRIYTAEGARGLPPALLIQQRIMTELGEIAQKGYIDDDSISPIKAWIGLMWEASEQHPPRYRKAGQEVERGLNHIMEVMRAMVNRYEQPALEGILRDAEAYHLNKAWTADALPEEAPTAPVPKRRF